MTDHRIRIRIKGQRIQWPRFEDADHIMVAGSARSLSDALPISFVQLINWLVADYGFSKPDAYQLILQVATVRVANMADPIYTVMAKFPKKHLPPKVQRRAVGGAASSKN